MFEKEIARFEQIYKRGQETDSGERWRLKEDREGLMLQRNVLMTDGNWRWKTEYATRDMGEMQKAMTRRGVQLAVGETLTERVQRQGDGW